MDGGREWRMGPIQLTQLQYGAVWSADG